MGLADPPAVTSFTFGCPPRGVIRSLQDATRPLRAAAAARGDTGRMSLWAGQGYRLAAELPAAEIVDRLRG